MNELNSSAHRWVWKLVMETLKGHCKVNGTPMPKHANVIAGDIARPIAERIEQLHFTIKSVEGELRDIAEDVGLSGNDSDGNRIATAANKLRAILATKCIKK